MPTCIYYCPTLDKELSYCLLFKLLESKSSSLFSLQTKSAIVVASHGYIPGTHMNKHTLLNNGMYIIDKMKANQECSSNGNTWVLRIPNNVLRAMFIWVKFIVCTHVWGSKDFSCVLGAWTSQLKQPPMLSQVTSGFCNLLM